MAKSFKKLFPTAGARTPFLDRFQSDFDGLKDKPIEPYNGNCITDSERIDLLEFIDDQLIINQPREEYKQLLNAARLFLIRVESPKLVKPSRYTHSRWMKSLIQLFYIYGFRNHFRSREYPVELIERLCVFGAKYYLKPWFGCQVARFAPLNDLNLFKSFLTIDDQEIKQVCNQTFKAHNSYVKGKLVALSFFDERIGPKTLREMVKKSKQASSDIEIDLNTSIADLTNSSCLDFFKCANLPCDFLELDPTDWKTSEEFLYCNELIRSLQCVNDTSERTISLCKQYCNMLSKDNSNLSEIIQTVEADIREHKKPTKNSYSRP